jgi:hypothetical protein
MAAKGAILPNNSTFVPLQQFANGTVFNRKTLGFMEVAETPAARPEILTPQGLMADTFRDVLHQEGSQGNQVIIVNDVDESMMAEFMESRTGREIIRNTVGAGR